MRILDEYVARHTRSSQRRRGCRSLPRLDLSGNCKSAVGFAYIRKIETHVLNEVNFFPFLRNLFALASQPEGQQVIGLVQIHTVFKIQAFAVLDFRNDLRHSPLLQFLKYFLRAKSANLHGTGTAHGYYVRQRCEIHESRDEYLCSTYSIISAPERGVGAFLALIFPEIAKAQWDSHTFVK